MAVSEDCGYPVPYDGKITDIVLTVSANTLNLDATVSVYINRGLNTSTRQLIHTFTVPASGKGRWLMPKKRLPQLKKGNLIVVSFSTAGHGATGNFNPIVSIAYQKDESMRVKSKPVDTYTVPLS
jgi:hypothetical protein